MVVILINNLWGKRRANHLYMRKFQRLYVKHENIKLKQKSMELSLKVSYDILKPKKSDTFVCITSFNM